MADIATLGPRQRNKVEKLQRIREATRALFEEKGFDETTMREIAQRARIGLGTIFLYASDKRDLLFLLYTEELEALTDTAFAANRTPGSFLDEIVAIFGHYYRFCARQPRLSRYLLRELTFFVHGTQGQRFQKNRYRVIRLLGERVAAARLCGQIGRIEDSRLVGRVLFAVYQAEIREWLLDEAPDPEAGLASLRCALKVVIDGLRPSR